MGPRAAPDLPLDFRPTGKLRDWLPDWSDVYLVTERLVPLQVIPILTTVYSPEIIWSAPNVLQVRVGWPDKFDLWVRNANGVRIDMRYDTKGIDDGTK